MSHTLHPIRSGQRGFTLVELLVVIGIIALLVAILMPALQKARNQAVMLECRSNMRQVYMALKFYADDFDGWIRQPAGHRSVINPTARPVWWMYLYDHPDTGTKNYIGNRNALVCQARPLRPGTFTASYALNDKMFYWPSGSQPRWIAVELKGQRNNTDNLHYYKLAASRRPAELYLVGDDRYDTSTLASYNHMREYESFWPELRHNKTTNMLFHDGHVEGLNRGDLLEAQTVSDGGRYAPWRNTVR